MTKSLQLTINDRVQEVSLEMMVYQENEDLKENKERLVTMDIPAKTYVCYYRITCIL